MVFQWQCSRWSQSSTGHALQELWIKVSLTIYWHLFFFIRACVTRVPNPINYMFTMHLHLSDGKCLSLQQETRPYDSGFPLGCCNSAISNLMERDPNCKYAAEKETFFSICDSIGNSTWGHGWSWWYCSMDDSMQRKVLICRASW